MSFPLECCCSVVKSCLTLCDSTDYNDQALPCMGFPRQEYWSGLPFPSPEDLPYPGIKPMSPALAGGFSTTEPPRKPHWQLLTHTQLTGPEPAAGLSTCWCGFLCQQLCGLHPLSTGTGKSWKDSYPSSTETEAQRCQETGSRSLLPSQDSNCN